MERVQKESQVQLLKDEMARAQAVVIADFRGLTVEHETQLRRDFREQACTYKVVKNTLLKLAVAGTDKEGMGRYLEGPTAIAFSYEDPVAPAKVAAKWGFDQKKIIVKGGFADGTVLDDKGVEGLSKLPGKDELRSQLLATLQAPAQSFVRLIQAAPQNFLYLLQARERAQGGAQ